MSFVVNGRALARQSCPAAERVPVTIRLARRRKPAGGGYLVRYADPLPEDLQGIAVSTFGKVIKRGWDWLGLAPAEPEARPSRVGAVGRVATGALARRPARYGLNIQFEARPDDPELGRLVESTVWVNEAHPAYRRAGASRSEGYHVALAVAMALAPLAVEPAKEHAFITAFLARWGAALERRRPGRRR